MQALILIVPLIALYIDQSPKHPPQAKPPAVHAIKSYPLEDKPEVIYFVAY